MAYIHGHAACVHNQCPMYGLNQAECCSGDYGNCVPTSVISRSPAAVLANESQAGREQE
jgi:hypothetical protein